jgi:hypothetical protein
MTPRAFHLRCESLGLHHPACGPAVRDFLRDLSRSPLSLNTSLDTYQHRVSTNPMLGKAIRSGLAYFDRQKRLYLITDKGQHWLDQLAAHQLNG